MSKRIDMHRGGYDLALMVQLRMSGSSYADLARLFDKDHTTIIYQCRKLGVVPNETKEQESNGRKLLRDIDLKKAAEAAAALTRRGVIKYEAILNAPTNKGKSYKQYLAESLQRKTEKNYNHLYHENTSYSYILSRRPLPRAERNELIADIAAEEAEERSRDNEEDPPVV